MSPVRRLVVLALVAAWSAPVVSRSSSEPSAHWPPDRTVDIEHVRIELAVDLQAGRVEGNTQLTVTGLREPTGQIVLHAVDFDVSSVTVDGVPALHDDDGERLRIALDPPLALGASALVRVDYSAEPRVGLYFVRPDSGYPNKQLQCWSQGEDEDNRHWFPSHDSPNERFTSETLITVDGSLQVVTNGRLLSVTDAADGRRTWHHEMDFPHVSYLVSLAIGDWATTRWEWNGIELSTHVPRARAEQAERSFANTAAILESIVERTGVPYPYSVYRQVAVSDYIYGGMENITATTLNENTLHDERAHSDWQSEGLVAHEAAHQWFGDYVTCEHWSDAWLNEGFATYFGNLAVGDLRGPADLVSAIDDLRSGAISADAGERRRPISTNVYLEPFDLFDGHAYAKGAMVLHALRRELGDGAFRRAVAHYLTENAGRSVDVHDLVDAVEESTGRDVSRFFAQWVLGAGQPELEVEWKWRDGLVAITVRQAQERGDLVGLFDVPLDLLVVGDGLAVERAVRLSRERETFHLEVAAEPRAVLVDPDGWLLRTLKIERKEREALWVLESSPRLLPRLEAARELAGEAGSARVARGLAAALRDPAAHWSLRREAARALARARSEDAREALMAALREDGDSRVRSAAAASLAEHAHDGTARALRSALTSDASYAVQAAAARSLGKLDAPGTALLLERSLRKASHRDEVFKGALDGLREMEAPRLRALCEKWMAYGRSPHARNHAVATLAKWAAEADDDHLRDDVRERLEELLDDPLFWTRHAAVEALGELGESEAIPALQAVVDTAPESRIRRAARGAVERLRDRAAGRSETRRLARELADERDARRDLEERVEVLEEERADGVISGESKGRR